MKIKFVIFVFLLTFPVLLLSSENLKLLSVMHGTYDADSGEPGDTVKFEFNLADFEYSLKVQSSTTLKIVVTHSKGKYSTSNRTGKSIFDLTSDKISGIYLDKSNDALSIRIKLHANYDYHVEKLGNSLELTVHSSRQNKPGGLTKFEKSEYESKYQSWENKLEDSEGFFYRGLFLVTLNYASIEGNTLSYSNGVFEFDEGLSSRQKLSFLGDGRVFDDYYLTVRAFYDPLDDSGFDYKPIRDLYFFARLEKGLNYLSVGDHDKESFTNLHLNRYTQSFLGAEAHFEVEGFDATGIAAISKGGVEVQEFKADNTTGPYQLSRSPVVVESEFVTIEERDKNSPTRIVNTSVQTRGVDYFINYEEGEITFVTPVPKESFNRNPNYIVVRYQYERAGVGKEYVTAAQVQASPTAGMYVGATYINKYGEGEYDLRDEVLGVHAAYDGGEAFQALAEYAYSRNAALDEGGDGAYFLSFNGELGDKLQYRGSYQRIEDGFINIANSRLKFYQNQIRLDGEAIYRPFENNSFTIGYRSEESNINHSGDNPALTNSSLYGIWQITYPDLPMLTVRYDIISQIDDKEENQHQTDTRSQEFTINAEKYFNILGETGFMAIYRHTGRENNVSPISDAMINLYGVKLMNRPLDGVMLFGEYRIEKSEDLEEDGAMVDYIIQGVGGRLTPFQNLNLDFHYEMRNRWDIDLDKKDVDEEIFSIGAGYIISSALRLMGRYEEREFINYENREYDQDSRTANLRFFVHPLRNLRFGIGYELEDRYFTAAKNHSYEDRLLLEASYRERNLLEIYGRYQLDLNKEEFYPLPETRAENNINLVGVRFWLGDKFDFLGRYKKQRITGADDNSLQTVTFEAGYQVHERYKFIIGFESAVFEHPVDLKDNYDADNLYLRLVAIF